MSYPSSLDSFPVRVDNVDPIIAADHNNQSVAILALETKLGLDNSTDVNSVDYFLHHASGRFKTHDHSGGVNGPTIPVANVVGAVATTGAQNIDGTKTFGAIPIGPSSDPTANNEFTRKSYVDTKVAQATPSGYLYGGIISNNLSDPTNDLDISATVAMDDSNTYKISAIAMTKRGDASFTAGTGNGGRSITGSAGKRFIFLIGKSADSTAGDYFFDTNSSGSNIPAGWNIKRLLGCRYWGGSAWSLFVTEGSGVDKTITLYTPVRFINTPQSGVWTDADVSAYIDTIGKSIIASTSLQEGSAIVKLKVRPKGSSGDNDGQVVFFTNGFYGGGQFLVPINSSGLFQYWGTASVDLQIWLQGFRESL